MRLFFPTSILGFVFLGIKIVLAVILAFSQLFFPALSSFPPSSLWTHLNYWVWPERISKYQVPTDLVQIAVVVRGEAWSSSVEGKELHCELKSSLIPFDLLAGIVAYMKLKSRHRKRCLSFFQSGRRPGKQAELFLVSDRRYKIIEITKPVFWLFEFSYLKSLFPKWERCKLLSVCALISRLFWKTVTDINEV